MQRSSIEHRIQRRQTQVSYAFLAPALLFFGIFIIVPMAMGIFTSFFNYSFNTFDFLGLQNYINLMKDSVFHKSMINTVLLVLSSVPLVAAFSLWVSTIIYKMSSFGRSFYRGVFYLPVVTGSVAVVVVWKWIFNQYYGILNFVLKAINVIPRDINWLGDKNYAIWCILAILFTTSIGQPIVLYIASLGNIDKSLIEAAEVDGATDMQVFWKIKWPTLLPTTLYVVVITTINSFQCFALIQLLTNGGPNNSTSTVMYYLYENAFKLYQFGYANAMGVILALIIGLFSAIQFKALGSKIDY
ncbi:MAG: sugar ABC transporter permease [Eubacteriales bacterium]|nr:sugar ABC transporter permease [Eubacteriales bacterium]